MRLHPWLPTLLIAACAPREAVPPDYGRAPVLLVHGLRESASIWDPLSARLQQAGYPAEYVAAVTLEPPGGANAAAARDNLAPAVAALLALADSMARIRGAEPPRRVDVVAHSMGALAARYLVLERAGQVRTLITLAGANHGSSRFCDPEGWPGAVEMCPAFAPGPLDAIQVVLNGTPDSPSDETPWGVGNDAPGPTVPPDSLRRIRYATLSAGEEAWIVPDSSTYLNGTGGWAVATWPHGVREMASGRFTVDRSDHDNIVNRRAAMDLIVVLLTN